MRFAKVATDCAAILVRAALFGGALLLTSHTAAAPTLDDLEPSPADQFNGSLG